MADHFITTNASGTNLTYTMFSGDIFVLQAGVSITGSGYSYIYGVTAGVTATIDGNIWLEGNLGSPFYFAGGDTISIGRDATMTLLSSTGGSYSGIMLGQNGVGGTSFSNHGHIVTLIGDGMSVYGADNAIVNTGMIDLTTGRMLFTGGDNNILENSGTITGSSRVSFGALIDFNSTGTTFLNSGEVLVARPGIDAVRDSNGGNLYITNSGEITSVHGRGIVTLGAELQLTNSGTITGGLAAINLQAGNNVVTNTGTIIGSVVFGAGSDTYKGIGGTLVGTIAGGAGGDVYYTSDSAMQIIELAAGGFDTVVATVNFQLAAELENLTLQGFAERAVGNNLDNIMTGNGADNRLLGLQGLDNLLGGEGDDLLSGGDGNDTLQGQDGNDVLRGGVGNDSLSAGTDDDVLFGGLGRDVLRGGDDNDLFIFANLADSGTTTATADLIADFVSGQDRLDLSTIDARSTNAVPNDAFVFIGTAAFAGAAGQLRYVTGAGFTTVQMDVDGNGTADMILRLTGTLTLSAQDFIL